MSDPTFAAANIKLDLPPKFSGEPSELSGWLFEVEQYCDIVGIVSLFVGLDWQCTNLNMMPLLGGIS